MRPSLVRLCVGGKPLTEVHRCVRHWVRPPLPASRTSPQEISNTAAAAGTKTCRWLSSSSGSGPSDQDIAELNEAISGFVGDLGDPDFDASPPPAAGTPTALSHRGTSESREDARGEAQISPSASVPELCRRLTLADHPSVVGSAQHAGSPAGTFEAPTQGGTHQSSMLLVEKGLRDGDQSRAQAPGTDTKSVLVLNGAACFIAGRLASTGEPRGVVMESMEKAAREFDLSLTVCTSNREDKLLDQVCEGDYDAIVYNPSGLGNRSQGKIKPAAIPIDGTAGNTLQEEAGDPQTFVDAERDETGSQQRQIQSSLRPQEKRDSRNQIEDVLPEVRGMPGVERPQWDASGTLQYCLARARCPVVVIAPRDEATGWPYGSESSLRASLGNAVGTRQSGQGGGQGIISGFSGVVSYRLAINAVASMLDKAPRKR